jgi:HAMP domain-containing protein
MGIKRKIFLGFVILACILLSASLISLFEFNRLNMSVSSVSSKNVNTIINSKRLLTAGAAGENNAAVSDSLSKAITELKAATDEIDSGFYRSIMPWAIAISAGIILIIIFNYFINLYLVNPIIRITNGVHTSLHNRTKYTVQVENNDELTNLNDQITDLMEEYRNAIRKQV